MIIAPFIKPIKTAGGTFYTCSSAAEDFQLTVAESKNKFRFSNFALLKLPELKRLRYTNTELASSSAKPNYIQLDAIPGAYKFYQEQDDSVENNSSFAESFQNYFYNLETTLTAQDTYSIEEKRTVSERVFFKWLKEIGAIRFRQANSEELAKNYGIGTAYGARYVEEDDSFDTNGAYIYERVVKYIGNINVMNSVKNQANSYSEVYIHVPTNHGSTKDVLFDAIDDQNYAPNIITKYLPEDPLNDGTIYGRDYNDTHPAGLRINAHYDSLDTFGIPNYQYWSWDATNEQWVDSTSGEFNWWYPTADENTYHLEQETFDDATNDYFALGTDPNDDEEFSNVKFIRSRLDGISLEFKPEVYNKVASTPSISNLGEYNASAYGDSFSFNTVLVYYDVYNEDNPTDYTTNLFGVLFLDNVDTVPGEGAIIESLTKYKPNTVLQQNGNSYAFKLNVKLDVTAQDPAVEVSINDYNTYSLHLYLDALTEMKRSNELLMEHIGTYQNVQSQLAGIQSLISNDDTISDIQQQLTTLQTDFDNAGEVLLNNENIVNLINKNYEEIRNIYQNQTSIEMAYNLDSIKQGRGIQVDRSSGSYVTLNNTKQAFNIGANPVISLNEQFEMAQNLFKYTHTLVDFDNYLRISDGSYNNPYIVDRDIYLFINDTNIQWQRGQKMRISFENGLNLDNENGTYNVHIYTDAPDRLNTGIKYNKLASLITYDKFTEKDYKPLIELICLDEKTLTFVTDIF